MIGTDTAYEKRHILGVLLNPVADHGKGREDGEHALAALRRNLADTDWTIEDLTGNSAPESFQHAVFRKDLSAIVAVGGDGMAGLGAKTAYKLGVPFGLVACGSGNDFARGQGLPAYDVETSIAGITRALRTGSARTIDICHAYSPEDGGSRADSYYVGQLMCGIDSQINQDADHLPLPGHLRYLVSAIHDVLHIRYYGFEAQALLSNGKTLRVRTASPIMTVANSRFIGGGIQMSPRSRTGDGLLELVWARTTMTARTGLRLLHNAYQGTIDRDPLMGCAEVTQATIRDTGVGAPTPIAYADGEPVGRLPIRVDVVPAAVRLLW